MYHNVYMSWQAKASQSQLVKSADILKTDLSEFTQHYLFTSRYKNKQHLLSCAVLRFFTLPDSPKLKQMIMQPVSDKFHIWRQCSFFQKSDIVLLVSFFTSMQLLKYHWFTATTLMLLYRDCSCTLCANRMTLTIFMWPGSQLGDKINLTMGYFIVLPPTPHSKTKLETRKRLKQNIWVKCCKPPGLLRSWQLT